MLDLKPNLQKLRHTGFANKLRRIIYAMVVSDGGWPPRFVRPDSPEMSALDPSGDIYVHIPFCRAICPHCPYNKILAQPDLIAQYHTALLAEIQTYIDNPSAPSVRSLYFGGGTPSMTPELVDAVITKFRPMLEPYAEVAIEIHPHDATPDALQEFKRIGINRISLGIETFDKALLHKLGRHYTPEEAREAILAAKAAGFDMVDINLIFDIPGQSVQSSLDDAAAFIKYGVDQISAYPLFTFEHTAAGRPSLEDRYAKTSDRDRLAAQRGISKICREAGLARTSVWSYTREVISPYTTVTRPTYRGFGAGAGSRGGNKIAFNTFSTEAYIEPPNAGPAIVSVMSDWLRRADWLYWRLYCTRVDGEEYEATFGNRIEKVFGTILLMMRALGFLKRNGTVYDLTERGAIWGHRLQSLFSLSGIDAVWTKCMEEPWPESVEMT